MRGARTGRLALAVICALMAAPRIARAAPQAADAATVKNEARERFAFGLRLFEEGSTAAALAEFKRAYALVPNPLVLYNIGLVYAAMDRPVESVDALEAFLRDGGATGEPARRARDVLAEQSRRVAEVLVITNQPATIEIDGVEAGKTPMERPLRVSSGAHVIAAQAPGYLPLRQEQTLAGQTRETLTLTLLAAESTEAHLTLTVSVPGAEVLVNGKTAGTTPLQASVAVAPGPATVVVRRSGYRTISRSLRLDEGAAGSLDVALEEDPAAPAALKGRLRLVAGVADAEVIVDGVRRAAGTEPLALPAGPHRLRVERAGWVPFEAPIAIAAGAETSLVVTLAPTAETRQRMDEGARVRRLWGGATAGVGAALAVGAAVYAAATRTDVSTAKGQLDGWLAMELDTSNHCYAGPGNETRYMALECGKKKAYYQDQVDSAKLRRDLAYAGVAAGVVAAGVGAYFLLSAHGSEAAPAGVSGVALWGDGQGAGVAASGRF